MARSDMFLKVTGARTGEIVGESNDKAFPGQIEVIDWSWGMSAPTAVGGQRTGRVQMRELKVVKQADKASTALMSVMNTNETITTALLSVRKSGGAAPLPYFVVKLEKARITNYEVQSDVSPSGAPVLVEHVTFAFKTITIDYTLQGAAGGSGGGSSFTGDTGET
jgi:type VI secretion system secreted protein Hcp